MPLDDPFIIGNESYFDVEDAYFACHVREVRLAGGGGVVGGNFMENRRIPRLRPTEKTYIRCGVALGPDVSAADLDVGIVFDYELPFFKSRSTQRFRLAELDGDRRWIPFSKDE